jgi:CubicO group peptidase (beta-lactamase class C family)
MNISTLNRTFVLLRRLFDTTSSTESILPVMPQKPPAVLSDVQQPFPRRAPETQGVPSGLIAKFVEELTSNPELEMHNLIIIRNGVIIYQNSFGGYDYRLWQNTYSECKSITSLAIGLLADDGKLRVTDRVVDILGDRVPLSVRLKHKNLTVEHLLTMTSTVLFNEAEAMASEDWVRSFLNSGTAGDLGETFNYNSLNSYMLSVIVNTLSGKSMSEFLDERLFQAMGIMGYFWEKCPKGIEKGGWGLYIRPEDMGKLGQLVMDKGLWHGKRLISEEWISAATAPRQTPPEDFGDYDYGYQIWVGRKVPSFLFNGMLSQNVLGFRDSGIIIVSNAGIAEMFQQSDYYEIARKHFSGLFPDKLPADSAAFRHLQPLPGKTHWWSGLRAKAPETPREYSVLAGRKFRVSAAPSTGLMPVFMQAVQNNYTKGTVAIAFKKEGTVPLLEYIEADESYTLPIGFAKPLLQDLTFHGEPYRVAVSGKISRNEDDIPVLKIKVEFIETPCTRILKFFLEKGRITMECLETPGTAFVLRGIWDLASTVKDKPIIGSTISKVDRDFINYKIEKLFQPRLALEEE